MTTALAPSTPASLSPFAVFRNANFARMWTGELVSTMGSALTSLAASILVFRLTNSAMSVGLMLMATAAPSLLVGLFAGVLVDRFNRKYIMIAADLLRAVLVFLIPFLVPHNIVWLYVIVLVCSAIGQFFDPAHESVLPEVASEPELASANSLMAISSFGSTAVGFAASGLIASRFPIEWAFYIDAATFLFSALCVVLIRIAPLKVEGKTDFGAIFSNLRAGAGFLFKSPILRSVYFIGIGYVLSIGLWNSLLLPFSSRALHATEFEYGLQEGLTSVGFVVGSLVLAKLADRWREGQWIVVSLVGMAIVGVLYSMSTTIPMAIVIVIISGFMNAPYGIARRLLIQRNTTREVRGRVNSTFFVTRDVVLLIGMFAAGLADAIDVRLLMFIAAVVLLIPAILSLVLPGLAQSAEEWRRAVSLLRNAKTAPGLGTARMATMADFDLLAHRLPAASGLSADARSYLMKQARVSESPAGTAIVRVGEKSDAAYFILSGRAIAGIESNNGYRVLEVLNAGDFFGEIAALTGTLRTANVVTEEPTSLLQVPAAALRNMMSDQALSRLILSKMTERLSRVMVPDLPRLSGTDQETLRDLRTAQPQAEQVDGERAG